MIRLGVIGYGRRIHSIIARAIRELEPDTRVVGVIDPDEKGVRDRLDACDSDACFFDDPVALVRDSNPDALLIGTRCNLHTSFAVIAAQFDLPLFLEKPVATSEQQALELETAFTTSNCPVIVSFPLRVSPLATLAQQYIQDGAVGCPIHIDAVNYVNYGTIYWEEAYRDYTVTQGLFLQKATHDFDYISFLMGEPIVQVAAMMTQRQVFGGNKPAGLRCSDCPDTRACPESPENRTRNCSGGITDDHRCPFSVDCGDPETGMNEDCSSALIRFASGAHGVYSQVFFARRDAAARGATISGYDGTIQFDWYRNELRRVRHHQPFSDTTVVDTQRGHFGGDRELARSFIAMIRSGACSHADIWAGIQSCYTCLAARRSALTGGFETVRQVGQVY